MILRWIPTFGAILSAIVSCAAAIWATRLAKDARRISDTKRNGFQPTPAEEAISQAWQDIQTIKEVISNVLMSRLLTTGRYDISVAETTFKPAYETLVNGYVKWGTEVPAPASEAWRKAKSLASSAANLLFSSSGQNLKSLGDETMERLREVRLSMGDTQMVLDDSRQTLRHARICHFLIHDTATSLELRIQSQEPR